MALHNPVHRSRPSLLGFFLLIAAGASAGEPPPMTAGQLIELPFEQLLTLEVSSASRYPQKIGEAPAAAVVVDAEEIRTYGYRTLSDILRSMPGLYISNDYSYDYIGVRGFSRPGDYNTRLLLLVDGYRVNDNVYNQAYIGNDFLIDVDMIARVEFIPGPGASAYGDNAFFGVINVITKSASDLNGGSATLEASSHDTYKASYRYGAHLENGAEFVMSATGFQSEGEDRHFKEYGGAMTHGMDTEDYAKLFAKFSYQGFTLESGYMRRPKRNPGAPYDVLFDDPRMRTVDTHAFLHASYYTAVSEHTEVSGSLSYGSYDYDGAYPYAATLNKDTTRGLRAGAELRVVTTAIEGHKLMGGIEYQKDLRQLQRNYDVDPSFTYTDSNHTPSKYGIFMQDEYALNSSWLLNAGLRYDHYEWFSDRVNPRIGLIYHPTPGNGLKLLYGSAYRAPNAYEMFYGSDTLLGADQKGNPQLDPETIRTYEAVLERSWAGWHGTLSIYHYDVHDLITEVVDPADGKLVFINADEIKTNGIEFSADHTWQSGVRFKGSVSYQDARDQGTNEHLTNSPYVLGKLALALPLADSWRAGLEAQYTGSRKTDAGAAAGYTVVNLTLGRRDLLKGLDLSLSAYNLFDREYADPADSGVYLQDTLRQYGRVLRLKLDYRF